MLSSIEIRQKYLDFFKSKGHAIIPSASLVPEDKTVLFNTAGMQPLVPYLLGQPHPMGKRLANVQKCLRTDDILEVGDNRHLTFFEMLGNWSLGDYFKKESIEWSFELLTSKDWFGIDPKKIYVTVFEGDKSMGIDIDTESIEHWIDAYKSVGIEASLGKRIYAYPKKKNWWELAGPGPCGPDTEIFYDTGKTHDQKFGLSCHVNCDCGRYVEIWNNVFMEYEKKIGSDGNVSYSPLAQKNVDTGMGFERMVMLMQSKETVFDTDLFQPLIQAIGGNLSDFSKRIVADHARASVFLIADGVLPSNKDQGYILRRLIRRAIPHLKGTISIMDLASLVITEYSDTEQYSYLKAKESDIISVLEAEEKKFANVFVEGERRLKRLVESIKSEGRDVIKGEEIFDLITTHGFVFEWIKDIADMNNIHLDVIGFEEAMEHHKELSRAGAEKKFGGHGLILNTGELKAGNEVELKKVTRLHTATHLLQAALRKVLGNEVEQRGSDITAERTRFDFSFSRKLTAEEIKQVEDLVNETVKQALPMQKAVMPLEEAKQTGALYYFKNKYPDEVNVYYAGKTIEDAFSKEFCGGPHVTNTSEVGQFKIVKEEGVAQGIRRIRADVS